MSSNDDNSQGASQSRSTSSFGRQNPDKDPLQAKYWSLLQETQQCLNPQFVEDLFEQDAAEQEQGRAALLSFPIDGGPAIATQFQTSDELRTHLDCVANEDLSENSYRRLYLLEDIGRNYVEVLGSRLRIPPAFFGAQYTNPSFTIPLVDPETLSHDPSRYFLLKYRQIHTIAKEDKAEYKIGLYYDYNSGVPRQLQLLDQNEPTEYSKHQVSYWGNSSGNESWVAVLLLDPLITLAKITEKYAANGDGFIRLDHPMMGPNRALHAHYQSLTPLDNDSEQWNNRPQAPSMLSMFDDLLLIHSKSNQNMTTKDPMSATFVCRNLVRCTWKAYLASRTVAYHDRLDEILFKNPVTNAPNWFQTWDVAWRADVFRRLFSTRLAIEECVVQDIVPNMKALGINYSTTILSEQEIQEWKSLQSYGTALIDTYATFMDAYLQENSLQESRTSNEQARSVGRLTALATVLVPFSIIAGMFSMGGDFLAGQSRFWVFWAVCLPVVVALGIIFFTTCLQSSWELCVFLYRKASRCIEEGWVRLCRKGRKEDLEETITNDRSIQLDNSATHNHGPDSHFKGKSIKTIARDRNEMLSSTRMEVD